MEYKSRKYRKCPFETYEPEKRRGISREQAVPLLVKTCNKFIFLGGAVTLFTSSILVFIKGIFGLKQRVRNLDRGKVIEFRD